MLQAQNDLMPEFNLFNTSILVFKFSKYLSGLFLFFPLLLYPEIKPRQYIANLLTSELKIDGIPDDIAWKSASLADSFIQLEPTEGGKISQKTEVRVLYDNTAVYLMAIMHDTHADSILHELGNRDEGYQLNSDAFRFGIDPYNKRQNGYIFEVSASGVQSESFDDDITFDAVWQSAVILSDSGWSVEIKIPYSALRFPSTPEQHWGVQFARLIRRNREYDQWTLTPKNVQNRKLFWGTMEGIRNINPPLRLSLTPYLSFFALRSPVESNSTNSDYENSYSYNGGADIKYGIDERFTLDMTLLPDFSQVQSDNKVKNLSAFETIYDEQRPFFKEGTALFSKGNLLYTRRIGQTPSLYYDVPDMLSEGEVIEKNPDKAKLLNATKLSGRTDGGLGIGLLNAVTTNTYAEIKGTNGNRRKILTEPLSNYNLFIFDQQLKNNCNLLLLNTNVMRNGKARDANVTTIEGRFENKKHQYQLNANYSMSQIHHWEGDDNGITKKENTKGEFFSLEADKIIGNSYYGGSYRIATKNYDKNDLGFNFTNDYTKISAYYKYNKFNPFWKYFKKGSITVYSNRDGQLSKKNQLNNFEVGTSFFLLFQNNWSINVDWGIQPFNGRDYYEPRIENKFYKTQKGHYGSINVSTNYNRRIAFDFGSRYYRFSSQNNSSLGYYLIPKFRLSDHFSVSLRNSFDIYTNDHGFAYTSDENDSSFFGRRDIMTVENSITSRYIFKNDMSLSLSARHYWSNGTYNRFFLLNQSGELFPVSVNNNNDFDFNSNYLTIDLVYNWQFAPGSSFIITYKNAINSESNRNHTSYITNLSKTFSDPQTNSISLKFLYYIDYQYFIKKIS